MGKSSRNFRPTLAMLVLRAKEGLLGIKAFDSIVRLTPYQTEAIAGSSVAVIIDENRYHEHGQM